MTVLQYIIVPFLLLFSFSARNSRTEEPHSVFQQNPFCQQENSDENESNDGLHKKWTSNKNEPIFRPSKASRQKVNVPFFRFTSLIFKITYGYGVCVTPENTVTLKGAKSFSSQKESLIFDFCSFINRTAGFTFFPSFVALEHKKLYVDHYYTCRWFGEEPRRPLTRPQLSSFVSLFLMRTVHHDGQRL